MWGWAGSVGNLLRTPDEAVFESLAVHHRRLWLTPPSGTQEAAWRAEVAAVRTALRQVVDVRPDVVERWSVVFEYELPLEGGRRPDVVVLAGRSLAVLEFKSAALPTLADVDQVAAYLRDLHDYHRESHGLPGHPLLVMMGAAPGFAAVLDDVTVTAPEGLASYLLDLAEDGTVDLEPWLDSPYEPLPALVEAARRIFRDEPLPHVKSALAQGIPQTVELLGRLADDAAVDGARVLALVGGVPGAGKTLVGLRLVYERTREHGRATFLSGNGPLVAVLQDALQSRAFVRDIHAFIRTNALSARPRTPTEHVIVFDEAQRAWDRDHMTLRRETPYSEPDLLVQIGERLPGWATLVGLIGDGQEIHVGEESGLGQWSEAITPPNAEDAWTVHCPPRLAPYFTDHQPTVHDALDLTVSLRSRRAELLHRWVALFLEGSLPLANQLAQRFVSDEFVLYVTRSLDDARAYARRRYDDEPERRFGLLASSSSKRPPKYGVDNGFMATSRMNVAAWYNAARDDPRSCCALTQPVTEFGCQGLELDLPIVCWGEDYLRRDDRWRLRPPNRKVRQRDPDQLLQNAYRVLLTRGRDGMVVWIPPDGDLDATEHAFLAAGARPLVSDADFQEQLATA
jgi:hypothetical protein